ncbi:MAG: hypothetical protein KDC67_05635 [Ignavibacteriae bacterium]|nr:hypothetical protein [Ignavibacteriota bacterium]
MKQILVLILIVFSIKSYSQNWEQILQTEQEEYFYKSNTHNTAWVKVVSDKIEYLSDKTQKTVIVDGYKMVLWKFDCRQKQIGIIQALVYNKDGEVLNSFKQDEILVDMNYVVPETIGETLLYKFCED